MKCIHFLIVLFLAAIASADDTILPGTQRLDLKRPLDEVMVDGLQRFCRRQLAAIRKQRNQTWQRDYRNEASYRKSVKSKRTLLKELIGAVDKRVSGDSASFELIATLGEGSIVATTRGVSVHQVHWVVLQNVCAEGLLLMPDKPRAAVVAVPDAAWTPEELVGLGRSAAGTAGPGNTANNVVKLAQVGCVVVIPTVLRRVDTHSGNTSVAFTNQTHREFLYRQCFEAGRHPIGFEVQKVLAAVDCFQQSFPGFPVGVMGVGEGGLLAFHAAAVDERVKAALVSGYFNEREELWREPVDRNVWRLLSEFGDEGIASLIAPRRLVVEACRVPVSTEPLPTQKGRRAAAAP